MNKIKKYTIISIVFIIGLIIGAIFLTESPSQANNKEEFSIIKDKYSSSLEIYKIIDDITGVNYIVIKSEDGYKGGGGITITPRLNDNGALYID